MNNNISKSASTANKHRLLSELFQKGLAAVNGQKVVEQQLKITSLAGNIAVVAVGKAASSMMLGAQNYLKEQIKAALVITKTGYADPALAWPCIEAGHPVPDANSLKAGTELIDFLSKLPPQTQLLALISGGASALVEVLPDDMRLADLQKMNQWLLSSGLAIHDVNRIRQSVSLVKGGKALNYCSQATITQFVISDVENDDLEIIGSGLFVPLTNKLPLPEIPGWLAKYSQKPVESEKAEVESHIVSSNDIACQAIINAAKQLGHTVVYHDQSLFADVFICAENIAAELKQAKSGLYIWGGETTLTLPANPGRGGRNQSLALALALILENSTGISVLVGATDGSDGPTEDAGAIIDGQTVSRGGTAAEAKKHLLAADAGTFLAEAGDLISTGPTGTNVMDIVIALKQ